MRFQAKMPQTREIKRSRSSTPNTQNLDMDVAASLHLSSQNLAAKTIIHNEKTYYIHPIYNNYAASEDGKVINLQTKETGIGTLHKYGRYYFQAAKVFKPGEKRYYQKRKFYYNHRFVYEAISQKSLSSNEIIKNIDGNLLNNSFDNLELVKRSEFTGKETEWSKKPFTCPHCQKQMRNGCKSKHLKSCVPKKTRLCGGCLNVTEHNGEICLECDHESDTERHSDDYLYKRKRKYCEICNDETIVSKSGDCNDCWWKKYQEDVDKKYNAIIEKIKNKQFPYKKTITETFSRP